jgi:hypothetical protein
MTFDAEEATMPALLSQRAYLADNPKSGNADLIFKVIACAVICVLLYKLFVP